MKEPVTNFNLAEAFKALDELNVPKVKGIKPNKGLCESIQRAPNTDCLLEDFYDVNDTNDMNSAKDEREAEVAKAKLARIEKIVDLEAETEDDILPSYVGKVIIQCPQCMTLFYKDPEDLVYSEDDDSIVNIEEVCQHCGNDSGYTVIGKVGEVTPEEAANYEAAEEVTDENNENSEESADDALELADDSGDAEESEEEPEAIDLDFIDDESKSNEETEKSEEDEEKQESFKSTSGNILNEDMSEDDLTADDVKNYLENHEEMVLGIAMNHPNSVVDSQSYAGTLYKIVKGTEGYRLERTDLGMEGAVSDIDTVDNFETVEDVILAAKQNGVDLDPEAVNESLQEGIFDNLDPANKLFKSFKVVCWQKPYKDAKKPDQTLYRYKQKEQPITFDTFSKAKAKAKSFSTQSDNGIADIYGIDTEGKVAELYGKELDTNNNEYLLTTFHNGKEGQVTTTKVTAPGQRKPLQIESNYVTVADIVKQQKAVKANKKADEKEAKRKEHEEKAQQKADRRAAAAELKAEQKSKISAEAFDTAWVTERNGKWAVKLADNEDSLNMAKDFEKLEGAMDYSAKLSKGFGIVNIDAENEKDEPVTVLSYENGKNKGTGDLVSFWKTLAPVETGSEKEAESEAETSAEPEEPVAEEGAANESLNTRLKEDKSMDAFKELVKTDDFSTPASAYEVNALVKPTNEELEQTDLTPENADQIELEALADIDTIGEKGMEECLTEALQDVSKKVSTFNITRCIRKLNNNLIIEGVIGFKSGKKINTSYEFSKAFVSKTNKNKIYLLGENLTHLKGTVRFALLKEGTEIQPLTLRHKTVVKNVLVEGLGRNKSSKK